MGAWTWAFIDESRSIGDCLSPDAQVSVHPLASDSGYENVLPLPDAEAMPTR